MAINLIDHEDVSITVKDATSPTPLSLALTLEAASLSIGGLQQSGIAQEVTPITRRGKLLALKRGDRSFPTVSLTFHLAKLQALALHNLILRREGYAAAVSTLGAGQKVFTLDWDVVLNEKIYNSSDDDERITIGRVHGTLDIGEEANGVIQCSFSGTCYGEITSASLTTPTPTAKGKLQAERA
jgi:hypothetical protein